MTKDREAILKILPEKNNCSVDDYDAGIDIGIKLSADRLEKRVAGVEEIIFAMDKATITVKFDGLVTKFPDIDQRIALALQEKFLILKKEVK